MNGKYVPQTSENFSSFARAVLKMRKEKFNKFHQSIMFSMGINQDKRRWLLRGMNEEAQEYLEDLDARIEDNKVELAIMKNLRKEIK